MLKIRPSYKENNLFKDKKNVHIIITYVVSLILLNASLYVLFSNLPISFLYVIVGIYVLFSGLVQHYSRKGVWHGNIHRHSKYDLLIAPLIVIIVFATLQGMLPIIVSFIVVNLYLFQLYIIKILNNEK